MVQQTWAALKGYQGVAWGSRFPEVERFFPDLVFVDETSYRLVTFLVKSPRGIVEQTEFKFFDEQLTAVIHHHRGSLVPYMTEEYVRLSLDGLGVRLGEERKEVPSVYGKAEAVKWDYGDILVFFQTFPNQKAEGQSQPDNLVRFVYKPIFQKMMRLRKEASGDDDYDDFDAVAF